MEQHLLLGHSFIRHLHQFCRAPAYYNFRLNRARVFFAGTLGHRNISYLSDMDIWVNLYANYLRGYTTVLLECGTNDLLNSWYLHPSALADAVYRLAQRILDAGARRVIVMQVLFREGSACLPRWDTDHSARNVARAQSLFNNMVKDYNRRILHLCNTGNPRIVCRRQKGLHANWSQVLKNDGCHLTAQGLHKYYQNIRSALVAQGFKARPY